MSELQTALIIIGALVLLALMLTSLRAKKSAPQREPASDKTDPLATLTEARDDGGFDALGVGKPRKRSGEVAAAPAPKPLPQSTGEPATPSVQKHTPSFVKAAAPKIVTVYVAEREGTRINGAKIHEALAAQKLTYNEVHKAYDRQVDGRMLFSVTSLTAPGHLDRAQAAGFSTPGLALFLKLPGPAQPKAALRDLLATAEGLAAALKAVLFDAAHQPLTADAVRKLVAEVDAWSRSNP